MPDEIKLKKLERCEECTEFATPELDLDFELEYGALVPVKIKIKHCKKCGCVETFQSDREPGYYWAEEPRQDSEEKGNKTD